MDTQCTIPIAKHRAPSFGTVRPNLKVSHLKPNRIPDADGTQCVNGHHSYSSNIYTVRCNVKKKYGSHLILSLDCTTLFAYTRLSLFCKQSIRCHLIHMLRLLIIAQVHVGPMRPQSRGSLRLQSKDPTKYILMDPNYLSTEQDRQDFRASIRLTRELFMMEVRTREQCGASGCPGNSS